MVVGWCSPATQQVSKERLENEIGGLAPYRDRYADGYKAGVLAAQEFVAANPDLYAHEVAGRIVDALLAAPKDKP
jgi:hypothetical protein